MLTLALTLALTQSNPHQVLISDLDVVWLNGHWQRWMTWTHAAAQPVREASLIALADVLVTTDELDPAADAKGMRPGPGQDLNTGVVYFRSGVGSLAMVQQWRKSMLSRKGDKNLNENVNDQSLFNQVVRGTELRDKGLQQWLRAANGSAQAIAMADVPGVRRVYQCDSLLQPCLPGGSCAPTKFTFGTLPIRPFTGGHTWFNQNVQSMAGHEQPQFEPITVHFTFQFGDTGSYPHGKRQRAREAALWAVDPPEYFTEGVFVALDGPAYTAEQQAAVCHAHTMHHAPSTIHHAPSTIHHACTMHAPCMHHASYFPLASCLLPGGRVPSLSRVEPAATHAHGRAAAAGGA